MKFCVNCGKQLDEGVKFCTGCGTRVEAPAPKAEPAPAPVQEPAAAYEPKYAYQAPEAPVYQPPVQKAQAPKKPVPQKKKKSKLPLVLGIAAVALVVVAAVVFLLFSGALLGDKGTVAAAFAKTASAYTEAAEKTNLDVEAVNQMVEAQEYNETMEFKIKSVPYEDSLTGLGIRMDMSYSQPQKNLYMAVAPTFGSAELLELQMMFEDDMLYAAAPDVVGDTVFAVNTENLGEDLYNLGAVSDEDRSLSINFFELMQIVTDYQKEMMEQKISEEDLKEILEAIEVEKVGKVTAEVNDSDIKCTEYAVVIPQDAIEDLLGLYEDMMDSADPMGLMKDVMKAMGAPDYMLEELEYYGADTSYMFESMYELVDEIGDLELSVFINKGYVMVIAGEMKPYDSKVKYEIQLGGGDNYVDDIRILMKAEGGELEIVSTGDHGAKKGVFTDETTVELDGEKMFEISSSFDPKAEDENFELHVSIPDEDIKLDVEGLIRADKESYTVNFDKLSLTSAGETLSVSMNCTISAYDAPSMSTSGALEILTMDEEELMYEMEAVAVDAMEWAEKFAAENAELMEILEYMMY